MAWRGAVWAETIGGIGNVVIQLRLPLAVEMFDHAVAVVGCVAMNQSLDHTQRALEPAGFARSVGQGEKRFGAVHVAVGTAIEFFIGPVAGEGFT